MKRFCSGCRQRHGLEGLQSGRRRHTSDDDPGRRSTSTQNQDESSAIIQSPDRNNIYVSICRFLVPPKDMQTHLSSSAASLPASCIAVSAATPQNRRDSPLLKINADSSAFLSASALSFKARLVAKVADSVDYLEVDSSTVAGTTEATANCTLSTATGSQRRVADTTTISTLPSFISAVDPESSCFSIETLYTFSILPAFNGSGN